MNFKVISYPGRGKRIREPLIKQLDQLVEDSWQQIQGYLESPYVLYGHSMGATIAYLIAHRIQQLLDYGGIPKEILENKEFFSFFEPIIRADLQAVETWQHIPSSILSISVIVMTGLEEDFTKKEINDWQKEFSKTIEFKTFPGGHFFIDEQAKEVANYMLQTIL